MTVVYTVDDIDPSCTKFALFSGGNDSVVSTHLAYKKHDIDWTVYLDTNTGVPANTEHHAAWLPRSRRTQLGIQYV
jgi:diphthamide synthase (EF-2-diphthine--ammonia ligase)